METPAGRRSFWERLQAPDHPAWWWLALAFALGWGHGLLRDVDKLGLGDWDYFTSQSWVAYRSWFEFGQAPFWSPYHCGGQTLVGNYQARAFSPSFLLIALLGVQWGNRIYMLSALAVGFEGARRLARQLGAGTWGALFAALAVAGNGAVLSRMGIGHFGDVPYLFLPWFLSAVHQASTRPWSGALKGGLWGALCLLEAGSYPLLYGSLVATAWMAARALSQRRVAPLLGLGAVLAATPLLCLFVLWPSARHLADTLRPDVGTEWIPLSALPQVFLSTDVRWDRGVRFAGQHWRWWEYGTYVGPVFFAVLLTALWQGGRPSRGWALLGALCTWYALGDLHPGAPWSLAHELPVFRSLRASGRALIPAVLCWSLAAAPVVDRLRHAPAWTTALALNLIWVVPSVLSGAFPLEVPAAPSDTPFRQVAGPHQLKLLMDKDYTEMTAAVLRNEGTLRCYEPAASPVRARPLPQQAFLAQAGGELRVTRWSPNLLRLETRQVRGGNVAVVNQNYHEDWTSDDGRPVRPLQGLLSTPVREGDDAVTLRFVPRGFRLGLAISLVSLLLLVAGVVRFERDEKPPPGSTSGPR